MTNQSDIETEEFIISDLTRRLEESKQRLENLKKETIKPVYIGTVFKNNDVANTEFSGNYVWVYPGISHRTYQIFPELDEYCFSVQEGGFNEFRAFTHTSFYGFARVFKVSNSETHEDRYHAVFCNNPLNYNAAANLNTEMAEKYLIDALKTKVIKDPDRRAALSDGQYFVSDLVEQDIDRKFTVMLCTHCSIDIGDNVILDAINESYGEPKYEFTLEKTGGKIHLLGSTVIIDAKNEVKEDNKDTIKVSDLTDSDFNGLFQIVEPTDDDASYMHLVAGDEVKFIKIDSDIDYDESCSGFGFTRSKSKYNKPLYLDWETTLKRLN